MCVYTHIHTNVFYTGMVKCTAFAINLLAFTFTILDKHPQLCILHWNTCLCTMDTK